jgi:hypothetical protein
MKRLKSRIDALESKTAAAALDANEAELLVSILGRRDALAWPWRFTIHSRTAFCEIRTRWKEYLSGQAGIASRADGKADWKTAAELRQRLISSGMATAQHSSGQVTGMFLSARGESMARGLVGDRLHSFHESGVLVLARLRQLVEQTGVSGVAETVLWNRPCFGNPSQWDSMTELIMPCVTSGLVRAESDTTGRIVYVPVDGIPEPPEVSVNVMADDRFDELYIKSFDDERAVLETCEARDLHECFIPLPANWPWNFEDKAP